jgi:hypothetical protein
MSKQTCDTSNPEARDLEFTLSLSDEGKWPIEKIHAVLLCDVRRELKILNAEITQLATTAREQLRVLKGIRKNTYKRRHKKKL